MCSVLCGRFIYTNSLLLQWPHAMHFGTELRALAQGRGRLSEPRVLSCTQPTAPLFSSATNDTINCYMVFYNFTKYFLFVSFYGKTFPGHPQIKMSLFKLFPIKSQSTAGRGVGEPGPGFGPPSHDLQQCPPPPNHPKRSQKPECPEH